MIGKMPSCFPSGSMTLTSFARISRLIRTSLTIIFTSFGLESGQWFRGTVSIHRSPSALYFLLSTFYFPRTSFGYSDSTWLTKSSKFMAAIVSPVRFLGEIVPPFSSFSPMTNM